MKTYAIAKRILIEMLRDKRTLALMFLAPLLILTLMYFLFQSNTTQIASLAVKNVDQSLLSSLKNKHLKIYQLHTKNVSAAELIKEHDYSGVLQQKNGRLQLTLQNSDQSKSTLIKQALKQAQSKLQMIMVKKRLRDQQKTIQQLQLLLTQVQKRNQSQVHSNKNQQNASLNKKDLTISYLYGSSSSTYFDTLLPIMIGFVVFFFVFLISGIALLRERTSGTLIRVLATPIKRSEIIGGYLLGYGLFAGLQTCLIVAYSIIVFKIQILGSLLAVFVVNLLLGLSALALGLFISTFAQSEFQMVQFIPLIIIPQIFFSGIIPVDQLPTWLQPISKIMPLYYGATAMSSVIAQGKTLAAVNFDLLMLVLFSGLFLLLNFWSLKKYRQA
ncbi:ABC transporter permease [Liquorilactobacillus vini]|uniref:ABC transporter permease n=1 Tax=Liquorilactobacillus vini TaxID=238015 RepID=UPI0002E33740|nr:ABC transporter permease [Liquorilactobacillus vini]